MTFGVEAFGSRVDCTLGTAPSAAPRRAPPPLRRRRFRAVFVFISRAGRASLVGRRSLPPVSSPGPASASPWPGSARLRAALAAFPAPRALVALGALFRLLPAAARPAGHRGRLAADGPPRDDRLGVPVVAPYFVHLPPHRAAAGGRDPRGPARDVLRERERVVQGQVHFGRVTGRVVPDQNRLVAQRPQRLLVLVQAVVQADARHRALEVIQGRRGLVLRVLRRAAQVLQVPPVQLLKNLARHVPARRGSLADGRVAAGELAGQIARPRSLRAARVPAALPRPFRARARAPACRRRRAPRTPAG